MIQGITLSPKVCLRWWPVYERGHLLTNGIQCLYCVYIAIHKREQHCIEEGTWDKPVLPSNLNFFSIFFFWPTNHLPIHCKEKMPKIWSKYSQKRNIGASVPISIFMCLWANYIFPRWSCRFCWRKYVDRSWEYINRSQNHECRNWGWGRAIPRKGIYKRNCLCSVVSCSVRIGSYLDNLEFESLCVEIVV